MTLALLAAGAVGLWVLFIVLLHFLSPEFKPAYRMCSEYALGKYGWLMQLAFLSLAAGTLMLVFAAWAFGNHAGLILLLIIGISFAGAGIFITDPINTPAEYTTRSGNLHNLFAAVAILLFPVMVALIRFNWAGILVWISCAVFILTMVRTRQNKRLPFGYSQRFMILAMSAWLICAALAIP